MMRKFDVRRSKYKVKRLKSKRQTVQRSANRMVSKFDVTCGFLCIPVSLNYSFIERSKCPPSPNSIIFCKVEILTSLILFSILEI